MNCQRQYTSHLFLAYSFVFTREAKTKNTCICGNKKKVETSMKLYLNWLRVPKVPNGRKKSEKGTIVPKISTLEASKRRMIFSYTLTNTRQRDV